MLSKLQIKQPKIVHCGKMRAKQTAEILAQGLNISLPLVQVSQAQPKDDVRPWQRESQRRRRPDAGQSPSLPRKIGILLLCGNEMRTWSCFGMETSSVLNRRKTGMDRPLDLNPGDVLNRLK